MKEDKSLMREEATSRFFIDETVDDGDIFLEELLEGTGHLGFLGVCQFDFHV
jgi:hypothetical protein